MAEAHAVPSESVLPRTGFAVRRATNLTDARAVLAGTTVVYVLA